MGKRSKMEKRREFDYNLSLVLDTLLNIERLKDECN